MIGSVVGDVWARWGDVLVAAVAGLVAAAIAVGVLVRFRRRRGAPRAVAWRWSVAEAGMVAGTLPWCWMILTPASGDGGVSLVPFRDLAGQLAGPGSETVIQLGGNLLVLAALGFFVPIRFTLAPVLPWVAGIAAAVSVTVEVLQYVLDLGRVSSIDDVLVNTAGAVVAAWCSRRWWRVSG